MAAKVHVPQPGPLGSIVVGAGSKVCWATMFLLLETVTRTFDGES